jgi:hypothetical protein
MKFVLLKATFIVALFFLAKTTKAQVYENANNEVLNILYRFAQKGFINLNDIVIPIDRFQVKQALEEINSKYSIKLSTTEKNEIQFYLAEYFNDFKQVDSLKSNVSIFQKDRANRFRVFSSNNQAASIFIDPIAGVNQSLFSNNKSTTQYFNGLRFWGYLGKKKRIGYNFLFRNVVEKGDSLDFSRNFNQSQGVINTAINRTNEINFAEVNVNINYRFNRGFIAFGRENLNIGYGAFGKPILSSKAPSFVNIRLQYEPFKWLQFDYFHGWLNSNLVDSGLSNSNQGYFREILTPKFFANHALTFKPSKKLWLTIGESMVYSDRFDIGYLIPFNFFKPYDIYVSSYRLPAGSNNQFYAQLSSRNYIKNTHIYASLFIDELRLATLFDKKRERNQVGYNIGFNATDFLLHYLTVGFEYTKIRGGVYNNIIAAQTYTNAGYIMGDWMGQNADRVGAFIRYTPKARLKLNAWVYYIRKGKEHTITQQYDNNPSTPFLHEQLFTQLNIGFVVKYEILHSLKVFGLVEQTNRNYLTTIGINSVSTFSSGVSFGF